MLRVVLLGVVVSFLSCAVFAWGINAGYPFILASAEARASLEVTAEQLGELKAARLQSDFIAFGILGALLGATLGLPECVVGGTHSRSLPRRLTGVLGLIAVGFLCGGLGAVAATWFEESVEGFDDPTMQFIVRNALLMLPPAVFVAVSYVWLFGSRATITDLIVGAIVGVGLSTLASVILHGTVTPFEARPPLMPDKFENRVLLAAAFLLGTGTVLLWFSHRQRKVRSNSDSKAST